MHNFLFFQSNYMPVDCKLTWLNLPAVCRKSGLPYFCLIVSSELWVDSYLFPLSEADWKTEKHLDSDFLSFMVIVRYKMLGLLSTVAFISSPWTKNTAFIVYLLNTLAMDWSFSHQPIIDLAEPRGAPLDVSSCHTRLVMILERLTGWEAWKPQLQSIHTMLPQHVGIVGYHATQKCKD